MYYRIQEETIEDIASAIRAKNGATGEIQVQDFAEAISELNVGENTEAAAQSASSASASAASASSSATAAAKSAGEAAISVNNILAREDEASKSAEAASQSAANSEESANISNKNKLDAEAWAVGKRDGVEVGADDETYENNAAYWAQKTKDLVTFVEMTDDDIQTLWDDVFKD